MNHELVTNGKELLFHNRKPAAYAPRRAELTRKQLEWCARKWPWFKDNRRVEKK